MLIRMQNYLLVTLSTQKKLNTSTRLFQPAQDRAFSKSFISLELSMSVTWGSVFVSLFGGRDGGEKMVQKFWFIDDP